METLNLDLLPPGGTVDDRMISALLEATRLAMGRRVCKRGTREVTKVGPCCSSGLPDGKGLDQGVGHPARQSPWGVLDRLWRAR